MSQAPEIPAATPAQPTVSLEDLRRRKGEQWAELGFAAYGNDTGPLDRMETIAATHEKHDAPTLEAAHADVRYRVAGRVMLNRLQGKLRFMNLRDGTGEIQLF